MFIAARNALHVCTMYGGSIALARLLKVAVETGAIDAVSTPPLCLVRDESVDRPLLAGFWKNSDRLLNPNLVS